MTVWMMAACCFGILIIIDWIWPNMVVIIRKVYPTQNHTLCHLWNVRHLYRKHYNRHGPHVIEIFIAEDWW